MSFQGLDPEVVRQAADGMERQAAALNRIAHDVDALIRTAMHHWSGPEAQDFHQWWVGQHRPRLVAAAQGVHGAAANVRRQVAEQEHASGITAVGLGAPARVDGGQQTVDLRGPALGVFSQWFDYAVGPAVGLTSTVLFGRFAPRDAAGRFITPNQNWRSVLNLVGAGEDGKTFAAKPGMSAPFLRWERAGKVLGPVGTVISGASSAWEQWQQDVSNPSLTDEARTGRAATMGVSTAGGGAAGAWAGAAVGAAIGSVVPGPGTAIGAVAGGVLGGIAGSEAGQAFGQLAVSWWN